MQRLHPHSQRFSGYRKNILGARDIPEMARLLLPGHLGMEGLLFVDVDMLERGNLVSCTTDF
jgi:hypothetical protein